MNGRTRSRCPVIATSRTTVSEGLSLFSCARDHYRKAETRHLDSSGICGVGHGASRAGSSEAECAYTFCNSQFIDLQFMAIVLAEW